MNDADLKIIMERCAKATGGPWRSFIEGRDFTGGSSFIRTGADDMELAGPPADADQDFIAAARQDVPRLIE